MSFIYKYLPPERKTYLSDALLRFTPPSALNDPYEALPGITDELIEAAFTQVERQFKVIPAGLKSLKKDPTRLIEYFYKEGMDKIDHTLGVLSLSKRWNSSLMWSHYAESHQGLCIGFNQEHEFFKVINHDTIQEGKSMWTVEYSDKRPLLTNNLLSKQEAFKILYIKSLDWKYEQEIRAVSVLKNATKTIDIEPYNISLFNVPHEAISEIIVGLRASDEITESATELAKKLSIPLYKASISKQSFDLERELINA